MCEVSFLSTELELLQMCLDQPWQFVCLMLVAFACSFGSHFFFNYKLQYSRLVLRGIDTDKNRANDLLFYSLCMLCWVVFVIIITSNNLYLLISLFLGKVIAELVNMLTEDPDPITLDNALMFIKLKEVKRLLKI